MCIFFLRDRVCVLNGTNRQNAIGHSASQCSGNGTAGGRVRDKGGGASSAITVSSRELVVRGAVGASLRVVRRRGAEVNLDEVVGDVERLAAGFWLKFPICETPRVASCSVLAPSRFGVLPFRSTRQPRQNNSAQCTWRPS